MKTYTIKEDRHYANFKIERLFPFTGLSVSGQIKLSKEAWYSKENIVNSGWNKLKGIGQLFGVHTNSGRIVYQANVNKEGFCTVAGYSYTNGGSWRSVPLGEIEVEKWYDFSVKWSNNMWYFSIDIYAARMDGDKPKCPVKLNPYFGGLDKAYHKMKFYFK